MTKSSDDDVLEMLNQIREAAKIDHDIQRAVADDHLDDVDRVIAQSAAMRTIEAPEILLRLAMESGGTQAENPT